MLRAKGFFKAGGFSIVLGGLMQWCYNELKIVEENYRRSQIPIVATVLEEKYERAFASVPGRPIEGDVVYTNPTLTLESQYDLKIQTENGRILSLSVLDGGTVTKEGLDMLVQEGSKISFPTGNIVENFNEHQRRKVDHKETYVTDDTQLVTKRAYRITVLDQ